MNRQGWMHFFFLFYLALAVGSADGCLDEERQGCVWGGAQNQYRDRCLRVRVGEG